MAILKTLVSMEGEGLVYMDTIEYEGKFWLVPEWLDIQRAGWSRPARIVCLSSLPHDKSQSQTHQFFVRNLVPKDVLSGERQPLPTELYEVVNLPPIEFETHYDGLAH